MDREKIRKIRREIYGKPKEIVREQPNIVPEDNPEINPGLLKMFPPERIKKLMVKEARRYKASLEKKWDRWLKAVNE